jgi:superfamily I DNA/RNA helicase
MEVRTIYGPPGTGKTRSLIDFAQDESKKRGVMFLSYTKAAAQEAIARIDLLDGEHTKPMASTIHSLTFGAMGFVKAQVIDDPKLLAFSQSTGILFKRGWDDEEQDGDRYRSVLSYARSMLIEPMDAYDRLGRPGPMKEFEGFVTQYDQWKSTYGYIDFDDMLVIAANTANFNPPPVVMLDEAQDCSPLQWLVFKKYIQKAGRVYVAGDDDQAIFEWNGADPHGMMKFSEEHGAKTRVLDQSWRVPRTVHEFLHDEVLSEITQRVDKKFKYSDREGALQGWSDVMETNSHEILHKDKSNLILVRDSYRMREIQTILHADHIPYTCAGSRSSPYESSLASAIRGQQKSAMGLEVTGVEGAAMKKNARDPNATVEELMKKDWRRAFKIPQHLLEFYDTADLFAPLNTKLSTIHQAKGTEADNVVVDLTITQRVAEGIIANRDAELRVWYVAFSRTKDTLHICGENELFG